jgi:hypothetical protein
MPDSVLKQVISRLEAAIASAVDGEDPPFGTVRVRVYDVNVLFETLRRYGGRRDWEPTAEAIAALPAPVRRHVLACQTELARLQRVAIAQGDRLRAAEQALQEMRKGRR